MSDKYIRNVHTFWYENGNSGYVTFSITIKFSDGSSYYETLQTRLSSSYNYDDTPLCDIEELLDCELTCTGRDRLSVMLNKSWWKDAVNFHDNMFIEEKENYLKNLKMRLHKFNEVNK